jgi:capsular polysaccharide biosynthesis protein
MWFIIQAQVCIVHPLSNPKLRQWELILSVWPEAWIFQPRPVVDLIFHLGINVALCVILPPRNMATQYHYATGIAWPGEEGFGMGLL